MTTTTEVLDDATLLDRAREGDRAAFGRIVERHQHRLFSTLYRLTGDRDDARELTQETFLRALAKLDDFRGDSAAYTWLFRIGMNLAISMLRQSKRRRTYSLDAPRNGASGDTDRPGFADRVKDHRNGNPLDQAERSDEHRRVGEALGRLSNDERTLIVLRDMEGFDYQQMAEVLELPLGTLKSRLFRARLALRRQLGVS